MDHYGHVTGNKKSIAANESLFLFPEDLPAGHALSDRIDDQLKFKPQQVSFFLGFGATESPFHPVNFWIDCSVHR